MCFSMSAEVTDDLQLLGATSRLRVRSRMRLD